MDGSAVSDDSDALLFMHLKHHTCEAVNSLTGGFIIAG
jgi:hypothetical protein